METTKHFICLGGCQGVSENQGVCQAGDCTNHNHELVECNCIDGTHNNFKACVNCGSICGDACAVEIANPEIEA